MKLLSETKANYRFEEKSVLELGFIFNADKKDITRLDFFETAIDVGAAAPSRSRLEETRRLGASVVAVTRTIEKPGSPTRT